MYIPIHFITIHGTFNFMLQVLQVLQNLFACFKGSTLPFACNFAQLFRLSMHNFSFYWKVRFHLDLLKCCSCSFLMIYSLWTKPKFTPQTLTQLHWEKLKLAPSFWRPSSEIYNPIGAALPFSPYYATLTSSRALTCLILQFTTM